MPCVAAARFMCMLLFTHPVKFVYQKVMNGQYSKEVTQLHSTGVLLDALLCAAAMLLC